MHSALAEFDLASKALNTYIDIVSKAKARVEKSGEFELGLDVDGTVVLTIAAGITILCVHGRRAEAERAQEIVTLAGKWLQIHQKDAIREPITSAEDVPHDLVDQARISSSPIPRASIAATFRAMGLSQARWSRLTYQPSERSDLQTEAILNLQRAAQVGVDSVKDPQTMYTLALAQADSRAIDAAIASAKAALTESATDGETVPISESLLCDHPYLGKPIPPDRRLLLRCWHLLALLLTAKQNFSAAVDSCTAALEIYGGDSALLSDDRTKHRNLGFFERRDIIEAKMTQLTLTEVIESPEEAVNGSSELLALYSRLFKYTGASTLSMQSASPPDSANGAPWSFRASLFGRSKNFTNRRPQVALNSDRAGSAGSHRSSQATETPSIHVTSEISHDGRSETLQHQSRALIHSESRKLHKRDSRKSIGGTRNSRVSSPDRSIPAKSANLSITSTQPRSRLATANERTQRALDGEAIFNEVGLAVTHDGPDPQDALPAGINHPSSKMDPSPLTQNNKPQNSSSTFPNPPREQNTDLSPILHEPVFPPAEPFVPPNELTRHSLTLLIKIWILIASLYRRASMPTDAASALSEAITLVRTIESLVAKQYGSSNNTFNTPGWSSAKAVAELWADVHSEEAMEALAKSEKEAAEERFEEALMWWPDHVAATVGLCNLLLDAYEAPLLAAQVSGEAELRKSPITPRLLPDLDPPKAQPKASPPVSKDTEDAELLSRLAARDRAYGLLSALTKSGHGWDSSAAWMALARAYELSGQVEKAKEAYWWVVELEEGRGIREWSVVGGW